METRYALEMCFAQDTNEAIRALWSRLREEGLFTPDQLAFDPHVTLAVLTGLEEDLGREIVDEIAVGHRSERELVFRGADSFRVDPGVVFLRLEPTPWLTDIHERTWERLAGHTGGASPFYLPNSWTPHVSLAERLSPKDLERGLRILAELELPAHGYVDSLRLISLPPARVLYSRAWD